MKVTIFRDMHSGGGCKEDFGTIVIEADQHDAEIVFFNRFGHNPHRVSCTCCGPDYSVYEDDDFDPEAEVMGDTLLIRAGEIKAAEKVGHLPQQGYVWVD
jgi:hypothetical protein